MAACSRAAMTLVLGLWALSPSLLAQPDSARQRALPHYRTGLELLRAESWVEAATAFRQAIKIDPDFELAYYGLGRAYLPQRKFVEAVAALTKSRDLYRAQSGRHFTNQQEAQRFRRDQIMEVDELMRHYQQRPPSLQVQDALRQLQERRRLLQEAVERGTTITIENSVPAYVSLSLGSAFFRAGSLPDAEREYKAAIAADPKIGEAHNNLAVVYLETGRYAEAERAVAEAERARFRVHPQLKDAIRERRRGT